MIPPFIMSIIPLAVSMAERFFAPSAKKPGIFSKGEAAEVSLGEQKKEYVWGLIDDLWDMCDDHFPAEFQEGGLLHDTLISAIDAAIEKAVKKLKEKKVNAG